jgi:membrane-associated phospholipid phosphatase
MKKYQFYGIILLYLWCSIAAYSQDTKQEADEKNMVPLTTIFHNIGGNALHSLTFNNGFNFAAAGLSTWGLIESGIDWQWRNFAYTHETLANGAYSAVIYAGYAVPIAAPLAFYFAGFFKADEKLQIAAMAVVQSMALANGFHSVLKLSTGRSEPYIINQYHHTRIDTPNDFSGTFDWFKMVLLDGWPSGHTMSAFATAATIAEIYKNNIFLKAAFYSYAVIMGLGVSLNVHWVSDVIAGALMGYAIGTTIGRSFSGILKNEPQNNRVSFSMTAMPLGIQVRF